MILDVSKKYLIFSCCVFKNVRRIQIQTVKTQNIEK